MRPLLAVVAAVLALLWSGLFWLLWRLAGAGGAGVVAVTRWLELEPSTTQWLADALDMAGDLLQFVVVLVWLIGLLVLAIALWLLRKMGEAIEADDPRAAAYGQRVVEGEITGRGITGRGGASANPRANSRADSHANSRQDGATTPRRDDRIG